jgi:hypothetical protein
MDGEPAGALPSVRRNDEDRIGGRQHYFTVPQVDDPHIHPVTETHQDFHAFPPQPGKDDFVEDFGRYLADVRQRRIHALLP